ncbi:MAG: hypothetical protein U0531_01835 [Dehalococcoidia bacterium]
MTKAYTPAELSPIEKTYLGVLSTGMVPARLAGDPTLRMDYITAVCLALVEGRPRHHYVVGDGPAVTEAFTRALTEAALALDAKGIISAGAPPPDILGGPEIVRPRPPAAIDFDQRPRIWDRYLGQQCMEELFRNAEVYPFLMGKYQDSAEVWGRLYQQGYGRRR